MKPFQKIRSFLFENTSTKQTIIKNTFWLLLAEFINKGSVFFITLFIAAKLGPEEFGVMSFVMSTVGIGIMLTDFGLVTLFVREASRDRENIGKVVVTVLFIRLILSLITLGGVYISQILIDSLGVFGALIMLYALYALINSVSELLRAFFRPLEYMEHEALLKGIQGAITLVVLIMTLTYSQDLKDIFVGFIIAGILGLIVTVVYIWRYFRKVFSLNLLTFSLVPIFLKKGFYLGIGGFFIALYITSDQVILGWYGLFHELGQYALAYKFTLMLSLASGMFFTAVLPRTSTELYEKNLLMNYQTGKKKIILYNSLFILTIQCILFALTWWNLGIYNEVVHILQFLFLYNLIEPLGYWGYIHLLALKKEHINLLIVIGVGLFNVVTNFLLIPIYGYYGAVFTTIVSYLLYFITVHSYILGKSQQRK